VKVRITKPDGRTVEVWTRHTMTREQIAWFKAGSALNAGQPVDVATGQAAPMEKAALAPQDTKAKPGKDV
jgi:hypothetical protein